MHPVDHAQAVEAANKKRRQHRSHMLAMLPYADEEKAWHDSTDTNIVMARFILSLSAPGPAVDAFDAREFIVTVVNAYIDSLRHGQAKFDTDYYARELTAAIGIPTEPAK